MSQIKSTGVLLVVALLAALGALIVDRSLFWPTTDSIEQDVQLLKAQLEHSRAQRDSLNTLIARRDDSLQALRSAAATLTENLAGLELQLGRQGALLDELRNQPLRYDQPSDSLLNDLNTIVHGLQPGTGANRPR